MASSSKSAKMSGCSYCSMMFKKLEHAQRHERTHTLDRPYPCETCGKSFARQDTLNRHARLHTRATDGPAKPRARRTTTKVKSTSPPEEDVPLSPVSPLPPSPVPLAIPTTTLPSFPSNSRSYAADGGRSDEHLAQTYTNSSAQDNLYPLARGISQSEFPESLSLLGKDDIYGGKQFGDSIDGISIASSSSESGAGDEGSLYATSIDGYCSSSTYPSPPWSTTNSSSILSAELGGNMTELESILASDSVHSIMAVECQRRATLAEEYVDYERFAESLEGPLSTSAPAASSFSFLAEETNRPRSISLGNQEFSMDYDFSGGAATFDFDAAHPYRPASLRSLTMPTVCVPLPSIPTADLYSNCFASLSTNGLGLSQLAQPQELYQAYQRRRSIATTSYHHYVPLEQPRFNLFLPWGDSNGSEMREEPALF